MDWMIRKTIDFFRQNGAIDDDIDVYEYGLFCLYSDVVDWVVTILCAIAIGMLPETLFYYIAFVGLRQCCGGFHASTRLRCFIISMATWLCAMGLIYITQRFIFLSMLLVCSSVVVIWKFAPIEHENNRFTLERRTRMKKRARVLSLLYCFLISFLTLLTAAHGNSWVPLSLAYGVTSSAISILVGRFLPRGA